MATIHPPHLLHNLRVALSVLYSLPTTRTSNNHVANLLTSGQAHDFLLHFQAKNTRRKMSDKAKSLRHKQQTGALSQEHALTVDDSDYGSTWLACLGLLALLMTTTSDPSSDIQYAEALFAAQTMVHRLRRVKLSEAVDIEFEPPILPLDKSTAILMNSYSRWMENLNPLFCEVLKSYQPHSEDEECIKGELTMLTVTAILYSVTLTCYDKLGNIRPLLASLASAVAIAAARLRYTSVALPEPAPNTQPIVTMIVHGINLLQQIIASKSSYSEELQAIVYGTVLYTCMTAVPDAILGNQDFSLDPRCFMAVKAEVRTQGITQVWESFEKLSNPEGSHLVMFLDMCQSWAKVAPLPLEFVRRSIQLVEPAFQALACENPSLQQLAVGQSAMQYWIAIMEGGAWTVEQVLTASLLQRQDGSKNPGKKRQTSKSKKRQKEVLEERTTENQLVLAQNEVHHRGDIACEVTITAWNSFRPLLTRELRSMTDVDDEVQGDGPVGAAIACANACLPYILRQPSHNRQSLDLFISIGSAVQEVCASASRAVRAFAAESLYLLHEVMLEVAQTKDRFETELEHVLVNHFYQCMMSLASRCQYPPNYFNELGSNNDEDLENERNDVRDVLRTISGHSAAKGGKSRSQCGMRISFCILSRLVEACAAPIQSANEGGNGLFSESALHAFSALAKPLNALALLYVENPSTEIGSTVSLAMNVMVASAECLIKAFPATTMNEILPLSRLNNLTTASLTPLLTTLAHSDAFKNHVAQVVDISIKASAISLLQLPELVAPSTLRSTRYDIRGAMRSPGGEDHVGCLALIRLATESEVLGKLFICSTTTNLVELCHLYEQLKEMEIQRGRGVIHGRGVLPKSRRLLLGVICHLEILSGGTAGASSLLQELFLAGVNKISTMYTPTTHHMTANGISEICESTFDLAAFSPSMIKSLFDFRSDDTASPLAVCIRVLHQVGCFGYGSLSDPTIPPEALLQWNRLRAALFCLLTMAGTSDAPETASSLIVSGIRSECEAVTNQCNAGPKSSSIIFSEELIGEDAIPAGASIQVVGEILSKSFSSGATLQQVPCCIRILLDSRIAVLKTLSHECPHPTEKGAFCDPRPSIAEAWFGTMNKIVGAMIQERMLETEARNVELVNALKVLILETCVSTAGLLLYPSLGKTQEKRADSPGMSFDGPQTLAMMEFLQLFFSLGFSMLQSVSEKLLQAIPIDREGLLDLSTDSTAAGISIIGAALFRGAQGGLPPWAVECIPAVFSSLFQALNKDPNTFGLVFRMGIHVRMPNNQSFGSVRPGSLLSGRFFENMSEKSKATFVSQATDLAKTDTATGWRRLKVLIKQASGGKKKDTDFNQKPAYTRWEGLDRV